MSDYLIEKSLLLLSSAIVSFWVVIWVMHICALMNAKMKLNKTTTPHCCHPFNNNKSNFAQTTTTTTTTTTQETIPVVEPPPQPEPPSCPSLPLINGTDNSCINNNSNNSNHISNEKAQTADSSSMEDKLLLFDQNLNNNNINNNPQPNLISHHHQQQQQQQHQQSYHINRNKPHLKKNPHYQHHEQRHHQIHEKTNNNNNNNRFSTNYHQLQQLLAQKGMMNLCNSYVNLPLPGVSIIKPLVGIDSNLHDNLETFFCMDYPVYELLFCVQDPDDAAILTVKNLFKLYPEVDAKLFTGGSCVGVNPKINNMQPAYEAVRYELVLISDSGISMKKDTLLDMVYHMNEDVALVHQMPFVCDNKGTGFDSIVEKVYFGTAHARAYLTADLLNINCPTGMSALMRKHLLDEVGGIKAFGQYLAEDFFFAKSFTDRGWKISISSQPAWQNTANTGNTISTLNGRIQRWIKLRYAMVPHWTFLEPLSECLLLGFLGAISISFLWAIDPLAVFIFHIVIWLAFDYTLLRTIQNGPLTFSISQFIMGWLVRESSALLIFTKALANRNMVTWRSRLFRLKKGGYAEEIIPDKQDVIFYLYCGDSL